MSARVSSDICMVKRFLRSFKILFLINLNFFCRITIAEVESIIYEVGDGIQVGVVEVSFLFFSGVQNFYPYNY